MSYLGIDIGGTKTALLLERPGARPAYARFDWPAEADAEADLAALAGAVSRLVGTGGPRTVRAAGIALPATVRDGLMVAWPSRPSWAGLRVGTLLERVLPGVPVAHEDDGSLAALAEAAATGARDLAYLGVGTGIGGGLVLGGALHGGPRGGGGRGGRWARGGGRARLRPPPGGGAPRPPRAGPAAGTPGRAGGGPG
ncbi:ROK family protein, partial [Streptomyces sp. NPDC127091]|uniref:ROK family protein n=1 Tax=Streptomyces sp. NPDC127091 TaxID=3347134 RepID=UPI00364D93CC